MPLIVSDVAGVLLFSILAMMSEQKWQTPEMPIELSAIPPLIQQREFHDPAPNSDS